MARRVERPGQQPILSVVRNDKPLAEPAPLARVEAEAMVDCATWLRNRAFELPEDSTLRSDFLASADDYATLARVKWPSVAQLAPVAQSQTA